MTCGVHIDAIEALHEEVRSAQRNIYEKQRNPRKIPDRMEVLMERRRSFSWALALVYSEREGHILTAREAMERVAPVCNGAPGVRGVDHDLGPCPVHGNDKNDPQQPLPDPTLTGGS